MTVFPCTAARTDVGSVRERNEDFVRHGEAWWVVADGMGGHEGGEVASELATAAVREGMEALFAQGLPSVEDAVAALRACVVQAGAVLRGRAAQERGVESMGTTIVAAALTSTELVVANVGDSRAYVLTPEGLLRLTRDDNVAEQMLAFGMIDAEQAQSHPGQYQLTKAVTAYDPAAPEPTTTAVSPQGRLLLCSDGLTSELCDETIARLLAQGSPDDAADALLGAALRAPARDNVSVVVVDLG